LVVPNEAPLIGPIVAHAWHFDRDTAEATVEGLEDHALVLSATNEG
jgi:hypothetical protein